jgi:hypothetical protein
MAAIEQVVYVYGESGLDADPKGSAEQRAIVKDSG